jgi:hypothetical protein
MIARFLDSKRNNSQVYKRIFLFYWSLPYEIRRLIFRLILPTSYKSWQDLRENDIAGEDDYSLAPFDKNKCIFVHIPKCAGVSVAKSLFGNRGGGHKTIIQYQLIFTSREFNTYYKFTIVRNPWDRLVSAFTFLKQGGLIKDDQVWAEKNISCFPDFHSFVINWVNTQNIYSYYHFIPQHEFLLEPKTQKIRVDFVGKFETLEQDHKTICEKLNISASLSKQNKTMGRLDEYRKYYDHQMRNIVANVYQRDIELFGYVF